MATKKEKWYNHGWTYAIAGAILPFVITFVIDSANKLPLLSTIKQPIKFELPLYILLIFLSLFLGLIFLTNQIQKVFWRKYFTPKHTFDLNKVLSHKAEKFGDLVWKWEWIYNDLLKAYEVKNAIPVCPQPKCNNYELKPNGYGVVGYKYLCFDCLCEKTTSESPETVSFAIETRYSYYLKQ